MFKFAALLQGFIQAVWPVTVPKFTIRMVIVAGGRLAGTRTTMVIPATWTRRWRWRHDNGP